MPNLHIIDYTANSQTLLLVDQVVRRLPAGEFNVAAISYGEALARYARLAAPMGLIETPALGYRFAAALGQDAEFSGGTLHEVLADSFAAADLVWFPWVHDHLFAAASMIKAVASFHDAAPVEMAEFLAEKNGPVEGAASTGQAAMADMATRRLMGSLAGVAAGSERLAAYLAESYGAKFRRPKAVPLPTPSLLEETALPLTLPDTPYIVHCGSTAPADNHESLLMALALLKRQGKSVTLALAGEGSDRIAAGKSHRDSYLRGLIEHLGLQIGADLHLLGSLAPGALKSVFARAAGAVLPTLVEGEAMLAAGQAYELGLPLACSDLPAIRGYFERREAAPLWFRPSSAEEIATALVRLGETRRRPPLALPDTNWDEVAGRYLTLFREQSILASTQTGNRSA